MKKLFYVVVIGLVLIIIYVMVKDLCELNYNFVVSGVS